MLSRLSEKKSLEIRKSQEKNIFYNQEVIFLDMFYWKHKMSF